jgi:hypothetical protein
MLIDIFSLLIKGFSMSVIRHLEINNFKSIKQLYWNSIRDLMA